MGPYHVEMQLKFPDVMISSNEELKQNMGDETIVIELAPVLLLPHAVFTVS